MFFSSMSSRKSILSGIFSNTFDSIIVHLHGRHERLVGGLPILHLGLLLQQLKEPRKEVCVLNDARRHTQDALDVHAQPIRTQLFGHGLLNIFRQRHINDPMFVLRVQLGLDTLVQFFCRNRPETG
jgi:hypothetical protein